MGSFQRGAYFCLSGVLTYVLNFNGCLWQRELSLLISDRSRDRVVV